MIGKKLYFVIGFIVVTFQGCTTLSQNEVFDEIKKKGTLPEAQKLVWIKTSDEEQSVNTQVAALLKQPLTQENAVRIALINNRSLQQVYEQIGISHSELVQAGLMSNPLLGYSVGRGGGKTTSTFSLDIAFLDLLWIPLRRELGGIALEETKYRVGNEVLKIARDTKKAYFDARVAEEQVGLYQNLLKSYETSFQLAIRQYAAGNLSKRDYLKINDSYTLARIEAIRLGRANAIARENLNRLLGVAGEQTDYRLDSVPIWLSLSVIEEKGLESKAISHRLDMAAVIKEVDYAAREAGYTRNTRFLSEGEMFAETEKTTDEKRFNTFGIKIPIPLFDFGQGRVNMAQSRYNQSVHHLYETAVNIRSEVREGYASYRYAYDIAKEYHDIIVPNNQQILEETQLFYNGMLDGIDHLLEDQRRVVERKMEALHSVGEYRKAYVDLEYAIGGTF